MLDSLMDRACLELPTIGRSSARRHIAGEREEWHEHRRSGSPVGHFGQDDPILRANGLIPPADRRASGYRDYSDAGVRELRFIRRARNLGFSVAEISELLDLWRDRTRHSSEVKAIASRHMDDLRRRIESLQAMVDTLQALVDDCAGDDGADCPIIERLERTGAG